ncbi:MAG: phage terminase large subunit [Planctomycetia bacterium]|nr:phage terminase large subunit [Planctomycetia bacterium]
MSEEFKYTKIQNKALRLLNGKAGNVMLFGGSRSGKTFVLCANIALAAFTFPGIRIAILRRYLKDVRESILMDTFPKVLRIRFEIPQGKFEKMLSKSDLVFRTETGSEIWFGGLDDKDRVEKILGKEYGLIFFNEVSQIPWSSIEIAKTRLAMKVDNWRNRSYYDCNPTVKSHWAYQLFIEKTAPNKTPLIYPEDYVSLQMNPMDNRRNISSEYLEKTLGSITGKARDRFLLGNWTEDNENALWKQGPMIDTWRVRDAPADLERIVVGVDPAITNSAGSDYTGIIVAGKGKDRSGQEHYYIIKDYSLQGSPQEWATAVVKAFRESYADRVVVEVNQGGDLVISVLRNVDASLPIRSVHASRGKIIRAEPIAALYEQGLVHHVGEFPELEEEMISYTGTDSEESPDRMDALVWAITDLSKVCSVEIGSFRFA